ncbi:hypothetical protein ACQ4PT_032346 [Festuca glaucescens]
MMIASTSGPDYAAAAPQVIRKALWTNDEDRVLREQVRLHGPHNWHAICLALPERNAKSCRFRWCQHLDPRLDVVKPFTPEEDKLIVKYQATYGNRWSTIADFLSGRTDNAIKNRWNSVLRKQYGHASTAEQGLPRQYRAPSASRHATGPELTPGCLPLFPLEKGDVRMDRRRPRPPHHAPDNDMSDDETCAAPMECLQLFPLAPGDVRANAGAAASSGVSCGADDPLTQLGLAPAARMVYEDNPECLEAIVMDELWTLDSWYQLNSGFYVRLHGPHNWDAICLALPERNAKSCRFRWCQHLDPRLDVVKPFTPEEDMLIVKYQATYGSRWSTIAEFLSGRIDNSIKNRWNSVLRKQHGHASAAEQGLPRQYWMDRRSPPLPHHTPDDEDMSDAETSAAESVECLQLFPLAPGDVRANAGAAASSGMSCGADDPLTQLRLAPAARLVFDVTPLRAYRM